tara:strand:+ start:551 stop:946 length:396 start_codon:yes stop_codon:yes gene_type:complete
MPAISKMGSNEWSTIRLENSIKSIDVGVHDHENGVEQPVRFDIEVLMNGAKKPMNDDLEEILDYEFLYDAVQKNISSRHSLLETIASNILEEILEPEVVIAGVVCITKLSPEGFDGAFGSTLVRLKPNFQR